jgi:hypothetical protein
MFMLDEEQSKEEDDHNVLHCNFIFFASFCVKFVILLYRLKYEMSLWCLS